MHNNLLDVCADHIIGNTPLPILARAVRPVADLYNIAIGDLELFERYAPDELACLRNIAHDIRFCAYYLAYVQERL